MSRFVAVLALLTACGATPEYAPTPSAPGMKRSDAAATASRHTSAKARPRRRSLPAASRDLRRHRIAAPPTTESATLKLAVTAYCATGSRNAAGNWPSVGTAAANAYPLGTRLAVEGHGVVTVEDRSAPGATDVDLYLGDGPECQAAAVAFGRQLLSVAVAS